MITDRGLLTLRARVSGGNAWDERHKRTPERSVKAPCSDAATLSRRYRLGDDENSRTKLQNVRTDSSVPGGGQPAVAARQVLRVSGHTGDAPTVAPLDGGGALDVCATAWSSDDCQGASSANRSRGTGKSAV